LRAAKQVTWVVNFGSFSLSAAFKLLESVFDRNASNPSKEFF